VRRLLSIDRALEAEPALLAERGGRHDRREAVCRLLEEHRAPVGLALGRLGADDVGADGEAARWHGGQSGVEPEGRDTVERPDPARAEVLDEPRSQPRLDLDGAPDAVHRPGALVQTRQLRKHVPELVV